MLAVQGANYIRSGPQPLGAINNGCVKAAWASADVLHVTKSGCVVAWKHDAETPAPPNDDTGEAASDTGEAASDFSWDPDQASSGATSDSANAASDAIGSLEAGHAAPSGHRMQALVLKLARCAL